MKNDFVKAIKEVAPIIEAWLPQKIKYDKTPGVSMGIIYKDKLIYKGNLGVRDIKHKGPITSDSLFRIASISKTFTAVAIMQLHEKGKLKLSDRVSKYIPWFNGKNKNGKFNDITVRQLLSHSAGVFRDGDTPHWSTGDFPKTLQDSFSSKTLTLKNPAGFKYSNYGFSLLGLVIESVTGKSYEKYIQENILDKLGMTNTSVDYDPKKDVVTGYGREISGRKREVFRHYKTNAYAPATGFVSSVNDLAKFAPALSFGYKGEQILKLSSKKLMSKIHQKTIDNDGYGFGLETTTVLKRKLVGHSGGFQGFNTQFFIDQKSGLGIVVLINTLRGFAYGLATGITDSIYRLSDKSKDFNSSIKINFDKYEGLHQNSWGDGIIVRVKNVLADVSIETTSPLKYATILVPTKKLHNFIMKTYSNFNSKEEIAEFKEFKKGFAQSIVFGATPSKRIRK